MLSGYGADIADDRRLFVYRSRFFSTIYGFVKKSV